MHSGPHSQLRRIYCPKGQSALARWSHSYWYPPLAPPFALFRTPVLAREVNKFSLLRHAIAAHLECGNHAPAFLLPLNSQAKILRLTIRSARHSAIIPLVNRGLVAASLKMAAN